MNKKVLLIDADLRKPTIHKKLQLSNQVGLSDLIVQKLSPSEVIQKVEDQFDVLTAGKIPPNPAELVGSEKMSQLLSYLKETYDYIIIDCPPSLGLITLNAFTASDSVLIPVQCEYYALEGLGQLINTINLVKKHLNKNLAIEGAVLTMYDMRTNLSNQVVREVKRYFDDKVYKTVIPRNIKLSEAPSYGMPITLYDANSKGARCYEKLAREIIKANEKKD